MTEKQIWQLAYFGCLILAIGAGLIAEPGYKIGLAMIVGGGEILFCAMIHASILGNKR